MKIIIDYNRQQIEVILPTKIREILKEIKKLIPEYYLQIGDRIEKITVKIIRRK